MVCTLFSRLLGIVKARVISSVFGASGTADVINFTYNIPNNFRKLFAEGALSSAYIPVFSSLENEEKQREKLLSTLLVFQIALFIPIAIISWVAAPQIVRFLSDFSQTGQLELSAGLLKWFVIFLAAISISALFSGVLQCHGLFFVPAFAPILFNLAVISAVLCASSRLGAYSMAVGVVAGGILQAGYTWVKLHKIGYRLRFSWNFKDPNFKRVMRAWLPVTITAIVAIIDQQVTFYFASGFETGSATAFSNAIIFWQTPYGIFFTAIATVFFPVMSTAYAKKDFTALAHHVEQGMTYLATFMIPSMILLFTFRHELVAVVLQTGRYTLQDTMLTARVLAWNLPGLLFVAWYSFLQRYSYSSGKYQHALFTAIGVAATDILLMWFFTARGMDVTALPLANVISSSLGCLSLCLLGIIPLQAFKTVRFLKTLAKIIGANLPLVLACIAYLSFSPTFWQAGSTWLGFLKLAGFGIVGIIILLISYRLFAIEFLSVLKKGKGISHDKN